MGLFDFFKKKESGLIKVDINPNKQGEQWPPKLKGNLTPSEKFFITYNTGVSLKKYNMEVFEARWVGEEGKFWNMLGNIYMPYKGKSIENTVKIYIKYKNNYLEKANYTSNVYDIIWSFIQSEKLRLSKQFIENNTIVKFAEEDYKEEEKWFKFQYKYLKVDDKRYELYQQSKELNQRIKEEDDKELIRELKETKKAVNEELKIVREKLKKIKLKNPLL